MGYDSGDAVSQAYPKDSRFSGGEIFGVALTVEEAQYIDLEAEARRLMMVH